MTAIFNHRTSLTLAALAAFGLAGTAAQAQSFTPGTLVVSQVGATGSTTALTSAATQVYLDEFTTAVAQANPIFSAPVTGLTNSGTATSEGALTLSTNGQSLLLAGYNASVGTAAVASSTSPAVYRGTAEVNAAGTVSTSFLTDGTFSGNNIRSTASVNGATLYSAGPTGLYSTTFSSAGASGTAAETGTTNIRVTNILNNNLYFSTESAVSATNQGPGIYDDGKVGTQTPTSVAVPVLAAGQATTNLYDFLFTNATTLFAVDQTAGLVEYTSTTGADGTFTKANTFAVTGGLQSLTSNGTDIYAVSGTSAGNSLVDFNIASGTFTTLATAAANTVFRGVDFAPTPAAAVPEVSTTISFGLLLALGLGGLAIAKKRSVRA